MDQATKDQIVQAAIEGKIAQVGDNPMGPLSPEQRAAKLNEFTNLLSTAKDDLISVLEVLRDTPGSKFTFEVKDDHINASMTGNASDETKGTTIRLFPPTITTEGRVLPPAMMASGAGGLTRGIPFVNRAQTVHVIAIMSKIAMSELKYASKRVGE